MKKQIWSALLVGVSVTLFMGCGSNVEVPNETQEVAEEAMSFTGAFLEFNEPYKRSLLATGQEDVKAAQEALAATAKKWGNIKSMFFKNQPKEYSSTQEWEQKLSSVGMLITEADVLSKEGKWNASHEKLEAVRVMLRDIRKENNITLLTDLMLVFHDRMERYLETGEKDIKELENLHLDFVPILHWEEFEGNEEYKKAALSAGLIVHNLEEVDGEEYSKLLQKLKPAFIKFYLQFG